MVVYVRTDNGDIEKTEVPPISYWGSSGRNFQKLEFLPSFKNTLVHGKKTVWGP